MRRDPSVAPGPFSCANDKQQVLAEYDGSDNFSRLNVFGNYIDELLFRRGTIVPTRHYFVHDHLFSPVAMINGAGVIYERYEYDAYGNCRVLDSGADSTWFTDDDTSTNSSNNSNPYLFTGRIVDILNNGSGSLTLQYNRNRYYSQSMGRWLTRDPLGVTPNPFAPNYFSPILQYRDGFNIYQYVVANPANMMDPYGLFNMPDINFLEEWKFSVRGSCDISGELEFEKSFPREGILISSETNVSISGTSSLEEMPKEKCVSRFSPKTYVSDNEPPIFTFPYKSEPRISNRQSYTTPDSSGTITLEGSPYYDSLTSWGYKVDVTYEDNATYRVWSGNCCKCIVTKVDSKVSETVKRKYLPEVLVPATVIAWTAIPAKGGMLYLAEWLSKGGWKFVPAVGM